MIHLEGFEEDPSPPCLYHAKGPLYNGSGSGMVSTEARLHSSPLWFSVWSNGIDWCSQSDDEVTPAMKWGRVQVILCM